MKHERFVSIEATVVIDGFKRTVFAHCVDIDLLYPAMDLISDRLSTFREVSDLRIVTSFSSKPFTYCSNLLYVESKLIRNIDTLLGVRFVDLPSFDGNDTPCTVNVHGISWSPAF